MASLVASAPEPPAATALGRRLLEHRQAVREAVAVRGGTNVRVFGSVARGEATAEGDLDLLVDLPPRTGILTIGAIARDVERVVGVVTDAVPSQALRAEVRARILEEAIELRSALAASTEPGSTTSMLPSPRSAPTSGAATWPYGTSWPTTIATAPPASS